MKRIIILGLTLLIAFTTNAQKKVKYKTDKKTGLRYYIVKPNKGKRIAENDIVFLNLKYVNSKDSVLFNSWEVGGPLQVKVTPPTFKGDFMDALKMLTVKDSAYFAISADSLFTKTFDAEMPPFIEKGSDLGFIVKIDRVTTEAIFETERLKEREEKEMEERISIDKYVADNKLNPITTESGLKYVLYNEGTGQQATTGKIVKVHYTGKLLDGTVFDSSYDRGTPFEFALGEGLVIRGWDEGIALLKEGGKALLIIPSYLGYGEYGAGGIIKPFSPLLFEVELIAVETIE